MSQLSPEQLQLIAAIEEAFKNDPTRSEKAHTLMQADANDNWLSDEEGVEARKLDTDHFWQEIPDQKMIDYPNAFSFLNLEGKRYYLPAYLRLGIKFPKEAEGTIGFFILKLYPWTANTGEQHIPSVESVIESFHLNKKQSKAIYHFLKFFENDNDDLEWKAALEQWKRLSQ